MKWKARVDDADKPTSEPELDPRTSDIDTTKTPDENKGSTYNLMPQKPKETTHDSSPEPEGYNFRSHRSKPSLEPSKRSSKPSKLPKPKPKPDKPGKVVFQSYGLRRPRPHFRKFNCIICSKSFTAQGGLNMHKMTDHPTVHFTCSYCNKQFQMANGHYKHEQSHVIFAHNCPYDKCNASFQFLSGLKAHIKTHTGKGLYRCLHYPKEYTTNRAMKAHAKTHTGQCIQCSKCPITFKTISQYNQHNKGHHGGVYVVPCGIIKQWPREVSTHKKKCVDCKEILF